MALLNPTFLLAVIVLIYLSTFVLFAILRILTGISIQRIGYFSLRRLAYTPKDGLKIEIRGLGLNLHRPNFAQPTWISIVINELVATVDVKELDNGHKIREEDSEAEDAVTPAGDASDTQAEDSAPQSPCLRSVQTSEIQPPQAKSSTDSSAR
ncbi:unnamed protein product [Parascedosporium putredinis]|uniref:Uncharacterized protein n=1 Tax=Parascedosporium putredinis TaxID=1442378 RepID=A0A9P1MFI4_9PEZI|nr:unnamed protein product [Parascedosporium putredinis]CAI8003517.1 unnamed protein product [Parascedosporium putredinis]